MRLRAMTMEDIPGASAESRRFIGKHPYTALTILSCVSCQAGIGFLVRYAAPRDDHGRHTWGQRGIAALHRQASLYRPDDPELCFVPGGHRISGEICGSARRPWKT